MGKKDDEIKRLTTRADELSNDNIMMVEKCKSLSTYKKELTEKNKMLVDSIQKVKELGDVQIKQLQDKIVELTNFKPLMDLTIHVTGVGDINKTLDDGVKMMESRLEALGFKDVFKILAHPHTMSIGIVR